MGGCGRRLGLGFVMGGCGRGLCLGLVMGSQNGGLGLGHVIGCGIQYGGLGLGLVMGGDVVVAFEGCGFRGLCPFLSGFRHVSQQKISLSSFLSQVFHEQP